MRQLKGRQRAFTPARHRRASRFMKKKTKDLRRRVSFQPAAVCCFFIHLLYIPSNSIIYIHILLCLYYYKTLARVFKRRDCGRPFFFYIRFILRRDFPCLQVASEQKALLNEVSRACQTIRGLMDYIKYKHTSFCTLPARRPSS